MPAMTRGHSATLVPLLAFLAVALQPATAQAVVSEDQRQQQAAEAHAAAAHEAAAQKALTDSLTDALAMLRHGSARAKEMAASGIAQMAIETTVSQPFHPVTFRNACVRAGIVNELVKVLEGSPEHATREGQVHALAALEAIATDDPTTELDNGHALACCEAGAVPPTVALLSTADEPLHVHAAALAAVLAENPHCQAQLLRAGAVKPLVALGSFGNDAAKLRAVAALDLLALNNPAALEAITSAGGQRLLNGIAKFGGSELRVRPRTPAPLVQPAPVPRPSLPRLTPSRPRLCSCPRTGCDEWSAQGRGATGDDHGGRQHRRARAPGPRGAGAPLEGLAVRHAYSPRPRAAARPGCRRGLIASGAAS